MTEPNRPSPNAYPLNYPRAIKPHRGFWTRLVRSRRVRIFFLVAFVLHAGVVIAISTSKTLHTLFFDQSATAKSVELTDREIEAAVEALTRGHTDKFRDSLKLMHEYRVRLDTAQKARLKSMRREDKDRNEKIAGRVWPNAEAPDLTAKPMERVDKDPPPVELAPLPDFETAGLVELYKRHAPMEVEAGRLFERYHAMELASSYDRPLPLSQAIDVTKLKFPKRRGIRDNMLEGRIANARQLADFRQELTDLLLETQDMVNNAARWVEMAESTTSAFLPSTIFGQAFNVVPAPVPYYGHYLNPRLLQQSDLKQMLNPKVALGTRVGKGENQLDAQWMSLDRWYCVGPFTHPSYGRGRERRTADLFFKYPPESGIDLNAVYKGRDGRELTWKYRVFGRNELLGRPADDALRILPYTVDNEPYAIWYFYTEVWSDEQRTVVGSFASDDFGMCWVNGTVVYQSPPDTQPWVLFTRYGFSPVVLRKGFNRMLFKLENWTGTTGFSVILMTYEDKALLRAIENEAKKRSE